MKKLITIPLLLLCLIVAYGQNKPVANEIANREKVYSFAKNNTLFTLSDSQMQPTESLKKSTLLNFNSNEAQSLIRLNPENLVLEIPTSTGAIELKLYRSHILADGFTITTSGSSKENPFT